MKTFLVAMLVLIILIAGILVYSSTLKNIERDLLSDIEDISDSVNREDWVNANKQTKTLTEKWTKHEVILAMFNDHEDLDKIRLSIGNLKESISYKNSEQTKKAITEIKILLERLKKNDSLSLENILGLAQYSLSYHSML